MSEAAHPAGDYAEVPPVALRSRLMLDVAAHMADRPRADGWPYREARVVLHEQGHPERRIALYASDTPEGVRLVTSGEAQFAIVNPAMLLASALRGAGPFYRPCPLTVLAVVPSPDQLGLVVAPRTGLRSLAEVAARRFPLRLSLRARRDHSVHAVVDETLRAAGFSLADLQAWGGAVRYDPGPPGSPARLEAAARGEVDAVFDEAVPHWAAVALDLGLRFLPVDDPVLRRLEATGFRRATIAAADYPGLERDVPGVDFSGWAVFTRADTPGEVVTAFCEAIEARRDSIPWEGDGPLPLERMCRDTPEGPLTAPLHPAAEAYWRRRGILSDGAAPA